MKKPDEREANYMAGLRQDEIDDRLFSEKPAEGFTIFCILVCLMFIFVGMLTS